MHIILMHDKMNRDISRAFQRYTYRVLQTVQMKLILLWAERAVLGGAKNALKFKYEM